MHTKTSKFNLGGVPAKHTPLELKVLNAMRSFHHSAGAESRSIKEIAAVAHIPTASVSNTLRKLQQRGEVIRRTYLNLTFWKLSNSVYLSPTGSDAYDEQGEVQVTNELRSPSE